MACSGYGIFVRQFCSSYGMQWLWRPLFETFAVASLWQFCSGLAKSFILWFPAMRYWEILATISLWDARICWCYLEYAFAMLVRVMVPDLYWLFMRLVLCNRLCFRSSSRTLWQMWLQLGWFDLCQWSSSSKTWLFVLSSDVSLWHVCNIALLWSLNVIQPSPRPGGATWVVLDSRAPGLQLTDGFLSSSEHSMIWWFTRWWLL